MGRCPRELLMVTVGTFDGARRGSKDRGSSMKRVLRRLCAMALAVLVALAAVPGVALAITAQEYWARVDSFVNDSKWCHGTSWNQISPKLSTYQGWGCVAYGCDFTAYVYGINAYNQGSEFYNPSEIRTGDVLRVNNSHTFVVLERDGSKLWAAEGGFGYEPNQTVRVSSDVYTVSGNTLNDRYNGNKTLTVGYHFDTGGATTRRDNADTTPPTISNARIGELREEGFTVLANVTDNVGVASVRCAVWTEKGGQDDLKWYDMVATDNAYSFWSRISFANHNGERGKYIAHVYAYDAAGNQVSAAAEATIDSTPPTISNVQVTDLSPSGYTITCTATDASGVLRVQFPTWTKKNDQDDIAPEWWTNPKVTGTKDGTTYTFNVRISDHNDEPGPYLTHIYAYDKVGNYKTYHVPEVDLTPYINDKEPPVVQSYTVVEQTDERIVVDVVATDNVGVARIEGCCRDICGDRMIIGNASAEVEQTASNKWRLTLDLTALGQSKYHGADRHRLTVIAVDTSGNLSGDWKSDDCPHVDFDLQMSRHVQLEVGQSISTTEAIGVPFGNYLISANWNDSILEITKTTITALEEGECMLYYINSKNGQVTSAYVVVGTPTVDLSSVTVSSIANQTYTGKAIKPSLTVKYGSNTLSSGTDYTASYSSNTNAGTATVTLTGKGKYTGTKKVTFTIKPAAISAATASAIPSQTYTGKALMPKPTLTFGGATLKENTDYTLAYKNNTNEGTATVTVTGKGNFTGTTSLTFKITKAASPKTTWTRLAGAGRYDTMSAIVRQGWSGATGGTVVVATGAGFKDALAAAGLAGLDGAPVVLTDGSSLSAQAASRLSALAPSKIYVAGGPAAVSSNVLSQIRAEVGISPVRVMGQTSSGTSAALARQGAGRWSGGTAIIATNKTFKDALSVAPIAYAKHWPILLADNGVSLSSDVLSALQECGITQVYIVGGEAAVRQRVVSQLASSGIAVRERLAGQTAVGTSRAIADFALRNGLGAKGMAFATSQNFPDALAGAALCGKNGSVLLLADDKAQTNIEFARLHVAEIGTGYVFGGAYAFSDGLLASLPTQ